MFDYEKIINSPKLYDIKQDTLVIFHELSVVVNRYALVTLNSLTWLLPTYEEQCQRRP